MNEEWLIPLAFDDRYCMPPSNDVNRDTKVDLTTLGVVTLDTTIVPDVLLAFSMLSPWSPCFRAPVVQVCWANSPTRSECWYRMKRPHRCDLSSALFLVGDSVAPDPVPSGNVCLDGNRYDVLAGNHGVCHALGRADA